MLLFSGSVFAKCQSVDGMQCCSTDVANCQSCVSEEGEKIYLPEGCHAKHKQIDVTCHCDIKGSHSKDYMLGTAESEEGAQKLCGECNNKYCRKQSDQEHIKSYQCRF